MNAVMLEIVFKEGINLRVELGKGLFGSNILQINHNHNSLYDHTYITQLLQFCQSLRLCFFIIDWADLSMRPEQ